MPQCPSECLCGAPWAWAETEPVGPGGLGGVQDVLLPAVTSDEQPTSSDHAQPSHHVRAPR